MSREHGAPRPTAWLLLGLAVTLVAVLVFSGFVLRQLDRLRATQTEMVDRSRRDSLQLVRIQNALQQLALNLRELAEARNAGEFAAHRSELERLRLELNDALRQETALAPVSRPPEQETYLPRALTHFWESAEAALRQAEGNNPQGAQDDIRRILQPQQAALMVAVERLLVKNNEIEERAVAEVQRLYAGVERSFYTFLLAMLVTIVGTSLSLIVANRRLFARLEQLSQQRRDMAQKLITIQEEVLHSISRELHDEFGQILTAIGAMLRRAEKKGLPPDSPFREELKEVQEATQDTLEKIRSLSRILHPTTLDDYGLEKTLDWYVPTFAKQSGMNVHFEKQGSGPVIKDQVAIHVYRILQEALTNTVKHAGTSEVWVRLRLSAEQLRLEVEDHGHGLPPETPGAGLGLVAMRERAALLHGRLTLRQPATGGTLVALDVPLPAPLTA